MKKVVFITSVALAAIGMTGCSNDMPMEVANIHVEETMSPNPMRVSRQEAIEVANKGLASLVGRSTRGRSVKNVEVFGSAPTRTSSSVDTMFYIVNYEGNGGFAVVSADRRLEPLYAISDEGNLSLSDTIENYGLNIFFRSIEQEATQYGLNIPDSISQIDPSIPVLPVNPGGDDVMVEELIQPMLSPVVRKWGQGTPFNYFCPLGNLNWPYLVGCVALSGTQILSYYEWPNNIGGYYFSWNVVKTKTDHITYEILARVGAPEYFNINYGYNTEYGGNTGIGSYQTIDIVPKAFYNLGYEKLPDPRVFSINSAITELRNNKPMLIFGTLSTDNTRGHAWTIDGLYHTYGTIIHDSPTPIHTYMFHCSWGFEGRGDGYYLFNTSGMGGTPGHKDSADGEGGTAFKMMNLKFFSDFKKRSTLL